MGPHESFYEASPHVRYIIADIINDCFNLYSETFPSLTDISELSDAFLGSPNRVYVSRWPKIKSSGVRTAKLEASNHHSESLN